MPSDTHLYGQTELTFDTETGQILRVYDHGLDMEVIAFEPGHELEINGHAVPTKFVSQDAPELGPAWQCMLRADTYLAQALARSFDIMRMVVVGSAQKTWGNHLNPPQSLHIRYRVERRQVGDYVTSDYLAAGRRPIQAPLWLDTLGTMCARTNWFGAETRMMAPHHGGAGPRSHVSCEDGPIAEVLPHMWNFYRRTHPGVQAIPGAIYLHPDGRWLWITAQRPTVGMHWDFENQRQVARFQYHAQLGPSEIVHTPEVSMYWGRGGKPELFARLNDAFIAYEEPADWWWNTCWYWMHFWQFRERGFEDIADHIRHIHDGLGVTGFALTQHDLRPGTWDCGPTALRPTPHLGGERGLKHVTDTIHKLGARVYVWMPFLGLSQPSSDLKADWCVRGEDGRPYESFTIGNFDMYHAVNYDHPEVQAYYLGWVEHYLTQLGVDGFFWDCGGTPMPPDFSPRATRPFQRFPSENMTAGYRFMEKVMQLGRKHKGRDFFMWHECVSTDLPATGYSSHTPHGDFMDNLNHFGRKRIVYRSTSKYNLYGAFPSFWPQQDSAFRSPVTRETYRPMIENHMNQWIVSFVAKHGVRDARRIADGVAWCAGHVVVDPDLKGKFTIAKQIATPAKLCNVHTRQIVQPSAQNDDGTTFELEHGAYESI